MAQKRMFDKTITNDDSFLEMPIGSQVLYFHLSMNADDDGFINNWKSIMRMIGAKEDDLKVLIAKSYVIPFDTGVIVIKHWKINNYLRNDRYKPTRFQEEYKQLTINNDLVYQLDTNGIHSIDKNRIEKNSIDKNSIDIYSPEKQDNVPYKEIIDYLNLKANTNYKHTTKKTKDCIKARFNEGFTLEDFKIVIDNKTNEWIGTDMEKYLRPETLFGNKFESYLNQKIKIKKSSNPFMDKLREIEYE